MMKQHVKWCILAGLGGLFMMQSPLHAQENNAVTPAAPQASAPAEQKQDAPAEDPKFAAYLAELKKKAEAGDADAARQVAVHYEVTRNLPEGAFWTSRYISLKQQAAEAGDVNAMYELGKVFYGGLRTYPRNHEEAFRWILRAADAGLAEAQFQAACLLTDGDGVTADKAKAAQYFEKALATWQKEAEQGNADAAEWVGLIYEKKLVANSAPEKSVPWLTQAAEQGKLRAQCLLAFKYRDGLGVPQDAAKAIAWFEKAAAQNDWGATFELGKIYRDGIGMQKDEGKAREWFGKGAELKDPLCMHALADMLVANDEAAALKLYFQAAEIGYIPSVLKAAELLKDTQTGSPEREAVIKLLRRVTDDPHTPGIDPRVRYVLAEMYYADGNEGQANGLMKAAAQDAYTPAMHRVAVSYLIPGSGMGWNPVLSYFYWDKAGEFGDEACASRAFWLLWGSMAFILLIAALIVVKFHRFARRRQAELAKMEATGKNGDATGKSDDNSKK